jgi:hypothetical protein
MAGAAPPAASLGASLARVAARLTTPFAYLAVTSGLQVAIMWQLEVRYGLWLPLLFGAGSAALLLMVAFWRGQWRLKLAGACLLSLLAAFLPTAAAIIHRSQVGLTTEHDGLLQLESAVDRLLKGQPIYGVDWSSTPMAAYPWDLTPGGNPALHHLAYYPLTVLVGVPVRLLTDLLRVPFDYRLVLLGFALTGLLAIIALPIALERRFMLVCAVYLSPLITLYLWPGRNDIEFLAAVLVCLTLMARGRMVTAALALGVAVALKPFAWMAVPFFLAVLWLRWRQTPDSRELLMSSLGLAVIPVASILPFFLAAPGAVWADLVLYASGGVAHAYPIAGFGFGQLLYQAGLIAQRTDSFPFWIFQAISVTIVLAIALPAFLRRPSLRRWMAGYAALLLAFTFFARFFNDNYAAVVITLFLCAGPLGARLLVQPSAQEPVRIAA